MICENCGHSVLPSDSVCWQCGAALAFPEVQEDGSGESQAEASGAGQAVQQIIFYALMTALAVLVLLLVIRSLGRQPRPVSSIEATEAPVVYATAPAGSFSIHLPAASTWYLPPAGRGQGAPGPPGLDIK